MGVVVTEDVTSAIKPSIFFLREECYEIEKLGFR